MSERLKNTNHVSNEEIIDDLTKDLQNTININENPAEFVINPSTSAAEGLAGAGDAAEVTDSNIPLPNPLHEKYQDDTEYDREPDSSGKDPDASDSDTDSIDEESLKNLEVDLTDDQKEERRIIVEELKEKGNSAFKIGDFDLSIEKYTTALQTCPLQFPQLRAILYCNRSAAKMKLDKYSKAIKDCTKAIELDDKYVKAYIRRGQSYEQTEKFDESLADWKKVLELDPTSVEAQKAVKRLPPLIEEKNEKMKTEMLGKLKDLGNMILKPFGLSTENFQMEQDPETKGYKINFKQ